MRVLYYGVTIMIAATGKIVFGGEKLSHAVTGDPAAREPGSFLSVSQMRMVLKLV